MGKEVVRIHPLRQADGQVLEVHLGVAVEDPGACQGMLGRRVDHTALGVEGHLDGMACLVGNFQPRVSAFQSPSTCLCGTASCVQ